MASATFALLGFFAPLALLVINLAYGYGGILVTILLFIWIGTAVVLLPEDSLQP
ncbi:MAG TPA: hypothetical protein VJ326_07855 [Thermoplasmata archaeon]|jgi:hypothetical protein|nr:hypothetical protein [Thermoplasmata archaeon]